MNNRRRRDYLKEDEYDSKHFLVIEEVSLAVAYVLTSYLLIFFVCTC